MACLSYRHTLLPVSCSVHLLISISILIPFTIPSISNANHYKRAMNWLHVLGLKKVNLWYKVHLNLKEVRICGCELTKTKHFTVHPNPSPTYTDDRWKCDRQEVVRKSNVFSAREKKKLTLVKCQCIWNLLCKVYALEQWSEPKSKFILRGSFYFNLLLLTCHNQRVNINNVP